MRPSTLFGSVLPHLLTGLLTCGMAAAQVLTGDIAVTGFSTSTFGIIRGTSLTSYATPGFGGTGNSFSVLWDPAQPNTFLIGGDGFIGRATITGPGTSTYALITNSVGFVVGMSFDDGGRVMFIDSGTSQVRLLHLPANVVTDVSTGSQPWGIDANAGARHPASGDFYVGSNGTIFRLNNGSTTAVPFASGISGYVTGVTFDPVTGEVIASVGSPTSRVVRVSAGGVVTNVSTNSLSGPNAVAVDVNGDFITGGGVGQMYRTPRAGGAATLFTNYSGPVTDVSVARPGGFGLPFGATCNGASGPVQLTATSSSGLYQAGVTVTTTSTNHGANQLGVLIFGFSRTVHAALTLPRLLDPQFGTSNCFLNASIDATLIAFTGGAAPANLAFALPITAPYTGNTVYLQHACFETVPGGMSWSNGLMLRVR